MIDERSAIIPFWHQRPALLIASACVIEILSMMTLSTFPSLIPVFQAEWGISNAAAGTISGLYFAGLLSAVSVLTALTDRMNAKLIFLGGLALAALGTFGFAFAAEGAWSAGLWRALQGMGLGATYMPGLKILTDHLPEQHRSRGTSFYTASYYLAAGLSYFLALELEPAVGWSLTFAISGLGPLIAFVLALWLIPATPAPEIPLETHLLDYRPVLRNRQALGFSLLYGLHNFELIAFSSWIIPFLVFSQTLQATGASDVGLSLGSIAALVSIVGLPASVLINEVSHRIGRQYVIIAVMLISAAVGVGFGMMAAAHFWWVIATAFLLSVTTAGDSATLTAGVVQVATPRYKGTTMSLYSIIGFSGAFAGPALFGLVLDLGGGERDPGAWILAFGSIAAVLMLGPVITAALVGFKRIYY